MKLTTTPDRLKFQLSHLYSNVGEDLSFIVMTQERLDEMVQSVLNQGFGAGFVEEKLRGDIESDDRGSGRCRTLIEKLSS